MTTDTRGTRVDDAWDCIVVGAGPGGLTAALYMARYLRRVLVLHDGTARALRIPLTHNAPGFPDGVTGPELIDRMTAHATRFGARIETAHVAGARVDGERFALTGADGRRWASRTLILATGLHLNQIPLPASVHEAAIAAGVLRYCPVCDGHEHRGKAIGVVGCDAQGAAEALFLRGFSDDVTLLPKAHAELTEAEHRALAARGVRVIASPIAGYRPDESGMTINLADGGAVRFDVVYPALGVRPRTELATALGVGVDESGCVDAGAPFASPIPGLYSAGDIVEGLDQINVAIAHGAIAATKAHNWLREQDGETLDALTGG